VKVRLFFAAAVLTGAIVCCSEVDSITLSIGESAGFLNGFNCTDDAGRTLSRDNLTDAGLTLVVDLLDFGNSEPFCRGDDIAAYCMDAGCPVIERSSYLVPLSVFADAGDKIGAGVAYIVAEEAGLLNVPEDRYTLIRVVATGQTGVTDASLDTDALVGCSYTCPVKIGPNAELDFDLQFPAGTTCLQAAIECATFELQ
jgi:hypothetical protein